MKETRICANCGIEHPLDTMYQVEGDWLCESCADRLTVVCDHCNERIYEENAIEDDNHTLCDHCFDEYYIRCEDCGCIISRDRAYWDNDDNVYCSSCWDEHNDINHIIWSSVSLEYDRKFRNFWGSTKAVRRLSDTICIENGLSIVENPNPHGKSYNKWLGDQAKPSHRELLRVAIDNALSQSPTDFEAFLKLLQESGCEVSKRGKSYRLKLPGWEKAARMDSLGEGYGLDDLQAVLSGKKAHTPRKKIVTKAEPPKVNLLVDIQAKLQAGKGAGYARWAKVFNLKQMAQTMNYLSENNLLEYAVLEEKAAAATAHHNELSAQIKAAEKRMAEIAVLRTHIVNYAKTREVYVAYRKAGYSKKFREEHEEEILLHQAAKNAFDEMGVKKLPKVKELQTEYAKLLEEKKKTYAEYRRSREEMRELLTAKANVDRVLKMEVEQDVEKEKDHGQR